MSSMQYENGAVVYGPDIAETNGDAVKHWSTTVRPRTYVPGAIASSTSLPFDLVAVALRRCGSGPPVRPRPGDGRAG